MKAKIALILLYLIFLGILLGMFIYKSNQAIRELEKIRYEEVKP